MISKKRAELLTYVLGTIEIAICAALLKALVEMASSWWWPALPPMPYWVAFLLVLVRYAMGITTRTIGRLADELNKVTAKQ